jgi:FkbM family methyltransferase
MANPCGTLIGIQQARKMSVYSIADLHYGGTRREFHYRPSSTDENVIKDVLHSGQYDLRRLRRAKELAEYVANQAQMGLRPLIIDAGANIGASAVYFMIAYPNALVVALEPEVGNFELLLKNTAGLKVEALNAAVSSTKGRARVFDPGEGAWGYRTKLISDEDSDGVPRVTVNDIYNSHSSGLFPFIVKIDIEGAEFDLFSGSTEWVERTPLIIIELHDWLLPKSGISRPFLECVSRLDRDFVQIGQEIYSIANDLGRQ